MSAQDISIPVYFVPWSTHMNTVINDLSSGIKDDDKSGSAIDALANLALANGYQIGKYVSKSTFSNRNFMHFENNQRKVLDFSGQRAECSKTGVQNHHNARPFDGTGSNREVHRRQRQF